MKPTADLIITGARIFTADAERRWADAMAVRAGRILGVGTRHDIEAFGSPATEYLEDRKSVV